MKRKRIIAIPVVVILLVAGVVLFLMDSGDTLLNSGEKGGKKGTGKKGTREKGDMLWPSCKPNSRDTLERGDRGGPKLLVHILCLLRPAHDACQ